MKILLAQGNPGEKYAYTRHNVGFIVLDAFAKHHSATFHTKPKFQADIAEVSLHGQKVLLVKPTTFYNDTGIATRALLDFYKLEPRDLLVIHDELSLPLGVIRIRQKGSDAGNNGIKSLNAHIGEQYWRLRIGLASPHVLASRINYVLDPLTKRELEGLATMQPAIFQCLEDFLQDTLEPTKLTLLSDDPEG